MPRRVKEEERIEMIIRGLLKQPENRRCINCNSLGPQYVCTTFWTFVCTNCSGVHREFTHRVKSVSMAKFNEEEITALQAGGNERARQIYFKAWDPQRNYYPDGSNLHRLREFVKHVYIDRKYAGENNKLSMIKLDSRNNSYEQRPFEKSNWGARDDFLERPSFERTSNSGRDDFYERSSFEKSSPSIRNNRISFKDILEERSPRYIQENVRSSSYRHRPTRFEIVDDRFRDDGSVKHYDRHSNKESRAGSRSPGSQRSTARSLPAIRPVKDILGEKVPALTIGGPPKANDGKDAEGSAARGQKAADATIPGPTGGKQKQYKTVNLSSLIDFDVKPEPTDNKAEPQAQLTASESNNESSSVASPTTQMATNTPNVNSVESLLFEWSAPVTSPSAGTSQTSAGATAAQLNSSKATDVGTIKAPEVSNNIGALAITIMEHDQPLHSNSRDPQVHQLPSKQENQTFVSPPGNTSTNAQQSATSVEALYNQQWNKSPASKDLRPVRSVSLEHSSQAANPGDGSTPTSRKEIPQDLFTSSFTSFTPAVASWQMHPPHGTGYGMQFHPPVMSVAAFPNPPKPKNPFDIGDDRFQVQAAMFPSMSSLQGPLPKMPASTALESQPSPYAIALSSHLSPYGMNMPLVPGAYMGQLPNNMPLTRPQGIANFGRSEDAFASLNPIQQASGTDSLPAAPNSSLSRVGNPFG
ncbi:hypothetical protein Pfo_024933 [Paulownia fortunei]|nr:hypothetical protein Pfo_024933 [Paulownia fortunei]